MEVPEIQQCTASESGSYSQSSEVRLAASRIGHLVIETQSSGSPQHSQSLAIESARKCQKLRHTYAALLHAWDLELLQSTRHKFQNTLAFYSISYLHIHMSHFSKSTGGARNMWVYPLRLTTTLKRLPYAKSLPSPGLRGLPAPPWQPGNPRRATVEESAYAPGLPPRQVLKKDLPDAPTTVYPHGFPSEGFPKDRPMRLKNPHLSSLAFALLNS